MGTRRRCGRTGDGGGRGGVGQRAWWLVPVGAAGLLGCPAPPPTPPPDPQIERDRECAQRFITPRLPTLEDVSMVYPVMLNPRDEQGRLIFTATRPAPNGGPQLYCYVESGMLPLPGASILPAGMPKPAVPTTPPGMPAPRTEVPCPPQMLDARWGQCLEGRVVTNAAHCPCACFVQPTMMPPAVVPMPCPPG